MKKPRIILRVSLDDQKKAHTAINTSVMGYQGYALIIADTVRHLAKAYKVDEKTVWHEVDKERNFPTTGITGTKLGEN